MSTDIDLTRLESALGETRKRGAEFEGKVRERHPKLHEAIRAACLGLAGLVVAGVAPEADAHGYRPVDHGIHGTADGSHGTGAVTRPAVVEAVRPVYDRTPAGRPCHGSSGGEKGKRGSATPTIIGSILGAVVGDVVKNNKDEFIISGAILGGSLGRDIGGQNRRSREDLRAESRVCGEQAYNRLSHYVVTMRMLDDGTVAHRQTTQPINPGDRVSLVADAGPRTPREAPKQNVVLPDGGNIRVF